jgi:threonine synthase
MVVAVAKAMESGMRAIMCASTGNTSASAAAYAAHAGLESYVLVPGGKVAMGKMAQAIAFGARIIEIDGNFDDALKAAIDITSRHPIGLVNSVNPDRIEGQKTAAFEVCEALGDAPDIVAIPVGNAEHPAYRRGFIQASELERRAATEDVRLPQGRPIVLGAPVADPETVASAIRIGNPAELEGRNSARDESQAHRVRH